MTNDNIRGIPEEPEQCLSEWGGISAHLPGLFHLATVVFHFPRAISIEQQFFFPYIFEWENYVLYYYYTYILLLR